MPACNASADESTAVTDEAPPTKSSLTNFVSQVQNKSDKGTVDAEGMMRQCVILNAYQMFGPANAAKANAPW